MIQLKKKRNISIDKVGFTLLLGVLMVAWAVDASAASGGTIGTMASGIASTIGSIGKAIKGASYVAGLAFAIGAIMKFKQHKDAPQQTPVGQPIGLLAVAVALLFMPSLMEAAGGTLFQGKPISAGASGSWTPGGAS